MHIATHMKHCCGSLGGILKWLNSSALVNSVLQYVVPPLVVLAATVFMHGTVQRNFTVLASVTYTSVIGYCCDSILHSYSLYRIFKNTRHKVQLFLT